MSREQRDYLRDILGLRCFEKTFACSPLADQISIRNTIDALRHLPYLDKTKLPDIIASCCFWNGGKTDLELGRYERSTSLEKIKINLTIQDILKLYLGEAR